MLTSWLLQVLVFDFEITKSTDTTLVSRHRRKLTSSEYQPLAYRSCFLKISSSMFVRWTRILHPSLQAPSPLYIRELKLHWILKQLRLLHTMRRLMLIGKSQQQTWPDRPQYIDEQIYAIPSPFLSTRVDGGQRWLRFLAHFVRRATISARKNLSECTPGNYGWYEERSLN